MRTQPPSLPQFEPPLPQGNDGSRRHPKQLLLGAAGPSSHPCPCRPFSFGAETGQNVEQTMADAKATHIRSYQYSRPLGASMAAQSEPLPPGWTQARSRRTGRRYFVHAGSATSTYQDPRTRFDRRREQVAASAEEGGRPLVASAETTATAITAPHDQCSLAPATSTPPPLPPPPKPLPPSLPPPPPPPPPPPVRARLESWRPQRRTSLGSFIDTGAHSRRRVALLRRRTAHLAARHAYVHAVACHTERRLAIERSGAVVREKTTPARSAD
jgi:hypothetical protein